MEKKKDKLDAADLENQIDTRKKLEVFHMTEMTLLELMEHHTVLEYENAIRSLFAKDKQLRNLPQSMNPLNLNLLDPDANKAPFHQVALSSLLN